MPKISELPAAGALDGAELVPVTQDGETVQTTVSAIGARAVAEDATLSALSGTAWLQNAIPVGTGNDTLAQVLLSANNFLARASTGDVAPKAVTDFALSLLAAGDKTATRATLEAQPLDATLTALAGLATGADKLPYFTGTDTASQADLTPFARTLLDDASATAALATLGIVVGTWTPTSTGITNITGTPTARLGRYVRIGNLVLFAVRNEVTTTAGAEASSVLEFTLPVTPTSFVDTWELMGLSIAAHTAYRVGVNIAQGTSARVLWQANTAASVGVVSIGMYRVS